MSGGGGVYEKDNRKRFRSAHAINMAFRLCRRHEVGTGIYMRIAVYEKCLKRFVDDTTLETE